MGWAAEGHKWDFIPEQPTSRPRCCGPLHRMQNGRGWKRALGVIQCIICRDVGSGQLGWVGVGLGDPRGLFQPCRFCDSLLLSQPNPKLLIFHPAAGPLLAGSVLASRMSPLSDNWKELCYQSQHTLWRCAGLRAHLSELPEAEMSPMKAFAPCLKQANEGCLTLLLLEHSWRKNHCRPFAYLCLRRGFRLNAFPLRSAFGAVAMLALGSAACELHSLEGRCAAGWPHVVAQSSRLGSASLRASLKSHLGAQSDLNFPKPVLLLR